MKTLSTIVGVMVLVVTTILVRGYCLSILWDWLVVPVFRLPSLGVAAAIGLVLFLNLLLNQAEKPSNVATLILQPLVALGLGYIIKLFI